MSARRTAFVLLLILTMPLSASAQDGKAEAPRRLRYSVVCRGDAAPVSLTSPGHSGEYALALACDLKTWARWNLPILRPVPGLKRVVFWARRPGKLPPEIVVRLLEMDGSEWQSGKLKLATEWRRYELGEKDFRYYRSRDSRKGTAVRMGRVIQVQFVPSSSTKAAIEFLLDDVSLEPGGPRYTFEENEQQKPMSAREAVAARFAFLRSVSRARRKQIAAEIGYAKRCITDVRSLVDAAKEGKTFDDLRRKYGDKVRERVFAFQQEPPRFDAFMSSTPPLDAAAQLQAAARRFSAKPRSLCAFDKGSLGKWNSSKLYRAKKPAPPAWGEGETGKGYVSQHVVFSPEQAKQVVFLNLKLDDVIDLSRRYDTIAFRYKITSNRIGAKEGIRLRLYAQAPHESWMDDVAILPDDITANEWKECRLDLLSFARHARFDPTNLRAVAFRIENQPGVAAGLDFCVSSLELRCEQPDALALNDLLEESRREIAEQRMTLFGLYDELRILKTQMDPALRRFYLWSQLTSPGRARDATPAEVSEVLKKATEKDSKGTLASIVKATAVADQAAGRLQIEMQHVGGEACPTTIEIGLFDHADKCVYSKRIEGVQDRLKNGRLRILSTMSGLHYWWPGYPYLYTLKIGAFRDGKPTDVAIRKIGFAKVECRQGDLSGTMRHARELSTRDYSVWINGQPHFAIGTHAGLGGMEDPRDFTALLQDLWLEFQRNYGFRPTSELWDVFDEEGLMYTCPIHPKYSAIHSYADLEGFLRDYEMRLNMISSSLHHPSIVHYAIGNEAELPIWGADLSATFGTEIWQPMEQVARIAKRIAGDGAPVCYVRASSFRRVPGIPSEDMSGVNQYTGRYGGRIEQIPRALRLLTLSSVFRGWPVMITEWNGPKYTWASTGIGGSSEHGCAYYIHKYWDSMLRTTAVVGSSEFVLNWICTRIEDLTTVSIEEGMKRRPKYSPFGGGHTAGHVPYMWPGNIAKVDTYRYLQAFQSPLYVLAKTPGRMLVLHAPSAAKPARDIAAVLKDLGKPAEVQVLGPEHDLSALNANILLLGNAGPDQPKQIRDLESAMVIGKTMSGFPRPGMPLIQKRVNPFYPDRALVVVTASEPRGYDVGVRRLLESARGLCRIRREEGAMTRLLIFADAKAKKAYQYYFNEFATRGYFYGLDDFRTEIRAGDMLDANGKLRQRFWNLSAVIVDLPRKLSAQESETLRTLSLLGVNVVVSWPCYERNPSLQKLIGVTAGKVFSLSDSIHVEEGFRKPLNVPELGRARIDRIVKFADVNEAEARRRLQIRQLRAKGAVTVAKMRQGGEPVALLVDRDGGQWFVFGCALRPLLETHCLATRRGQTHPLYDRGTACGLERLSRLVTNLCRAGAPGEKDLHVIHGTIDPSASTLRSDDRVHLRLRLVDERDRPVTGATVLAAPEYVRNCLGYSRKAADQYVRIAESETEKGTYEFSLALADDEHPATQPGNTAVRRVFIARPSASPRLGEAAICISLKAIKKDHLLYEDAAALLLRP